MSPALKRTPIATVKIVNEDGTEQAYDIENPTQEQRDALLAYAPPVAFLARSDDPSQKRTPEQEAADEEREAALMAEKQRGATQAVSAEEVGDPAHDPNAQPQEDPS